MAGFFSKLFGPKKTTPAPKPAGGFMERLFAWAKKKKAGQEEGGKPPPPPIAPPPPPPAPPAPPHKGHPDRLPPDDPGRQWHPSGGLEIRAVDPEDVVYGGEWVMAASSNVERWRYLHDEEILEVEFKSGGYYRYFQVPEELPFDFLITPSPGRFVWNRLRDRYPYERVRSLETYNVGPKKQKPRRPTVVRMTTPKEIKEGKVIGP